MKKLLLFILLFSANDVRLNAQSCTPDPNITAPGLYPDTTDNLMPGYKNVYYEEHIQVNTIKDTTLSVGYVKVDYGEMTSISGLPPGISYVCNPLSCRVNGGMKGCILFYGTCSTPGVYNITFTIKIAGKLWGTIPFSQNQIVNGYRIVINGPPVASFTSNVQNICMGGTVKFYEAASGAPDTWDWTFTGGDPSTSTAKKPIVKYYQPGNYDVELKVSSPAGTNTYLKSQYVYAGGVEAAITINGNDSICPGGVTDLEATAGNNLGYQWRKSGIDILGANNQTYTTAAGGNYSVVITDYNSGCIDESLKTKITLSYPTATINSMGAVQFCTGQSCGLKATHVPGQTYQWYRKGIAIAGATNKTYTATLGGNYKCLVTNSLGCSAFSNALTLSIVCRDGLTTSAVQISPNPVSDYINLQIDINEDETLHLEVYDMKGQMISDLGNHYVNAGSQQIELPATTISDGIYLLKLTGNKTQQAVKFSVQKN